jgi:DNA helicase-2/ATP-dependent DNA helicase PcrA
VEGLGEGADEEPAIPLDAFHAGERVRHAKFGEGIVVSCQEASGDLLVTVAFKGDAGLKRLLASFAALERL